MALMNFKNEWHAFCNNREILAQFLQPIGVEVWTAGDGEAALQAVRQRWPDIVFLDIRLPGMSGTEVFTRLAEERGADQMKVVAISASVLEHERHRCLELGFDAFVGKPFRKEELYACLAEQLGIEYEREGPAVEVPKQDPRTAQVPVIFLTARDEAADIADIQRLVCVTYRHD